MIRMTSTDWLWAQVSPLREAANEFQGKKLGIEDVLYVALIVAGVAFVFWLLHRALAKQERQKPYYSPRKLFKELCQAHELDRASIRLLKELAAHHKLPHPASLFTQPHLFEPAAAGKIANRHAEALVDLQVKLFSWVTPATATGDFSRTQAVA